MKPQHIVEEYCSREGAPALGMGSEIATARSVLRQISQAVSLDHAKQLAQTYLDHFEVNHGRASTFE